jgi:hypothetical protein
MILHRKPVDDARANAMAYFSLFAGLGLRTMSFSDPTEATILVDKTYPQCTSSNNHLYHLSIDS